MTTKFQCHYNLSIQFEDNNGNIQQYNVSDPITINFNINKSTFQESSSTTIQVINMDESIRNSIYVDRLFFASNKRKTLSLFAGYGKERTLCCFGDIVQCYSSIQDTNIVTVIEVLEPDILTKNTGVTFEAGTTYKEAYTYLANELTGLKIGEIGQLDGEFKMPTVFNGNTFWLLSKLTGIHAFCDNGVINMLNDNETIADYGVYVIDSSSGLLSTPIRHEAQLEVIMLFEPTVKLGQLVEIRSETQSCFNGQYKICGINHNCTISGSEGGTRTTTLSLLYIDFLSNSNVNITNNPQGKTPVKISNGKELPINGSAPSDVLQVYNYIIKNNGKIPNTTADKHKKIFWKDLIGHNNTDSERVSQLTPAILTYCKNAAESLVDFCNINFPGKKITVTSCWRSTQNNNREGGKPDSRHLKGQAIDFKVNGISIIKLYQTVATKWNRGYVGKYSTFVHAQIAGNPNKKYRG